jgi:hypothetical protein
VRWRKSSFSGDDADTGACVEVAFADETVGVRDSKDSDGTPLVFSPTAWRQFRRAPQAEPGAASRR